MRRSLFRCLSLMSLVGLIAVVSGLGGVVLAQSQVGSELPPTTITPAQPDASEQTPSDSGKRLVLDDYLRHHPKLSQKLHRNPELLDDPVFVRNHRELREFMTLHPGSREQFESTAKNLGEKG